MDDKEQVHKLGEEIQREAYTRTPALKEIRTLTKLYGIDGASVLCQVTEKTYRRWTRGTLDPGSQGRRNINLLIELTDIVLNAGIEPRVWMFTENRYLEGRLPGEVLRLDPGLVRMAAYAAASSPHVS